MRVRITRARASGQGAKLAQMAGAEQAGDAELVARWREGDRRAFVLEVVDDIRNAGDRDAEVPVEPVLHEHHGVIALFDGLLVEVLGELRKVVVVVPDGDRDVLLRGGELVPDLFGQQLVETVFLHASTVPAGTDRFQTGKASLRCEPRSLRRPHQTRSLRRLQAVSKGPLGNRFGLDCADAVLKLAEYRAQGALRVETGGAGSGDETE